MGQDFNIMPSAYQIMQFGLEELPCKIEIRGRARNFCLEGQFVLLIYYLYRLPYTYKNTYIYTHRHTQFSIFHSEIPKIKCFMELNSSFSIFYSEILKMFVFNIHMLPNCLPLPVKKFSIELMKCSNMNDPKF